MRDVDAPTETESGEEHYSAGLPIWTWLLAAIGLGLLFLSSEEMLGEFPGDIALALGCASIIPWAYYSAIDPTSSGHWRFKGWALLVGFVFVIFVVLLARFGGCTA